MSQSIPFSSPDLLQHFRTAIENVEDQVIEKALLNVPQNNLTAWDNPTDNCYSKALNKKSAHRNLPGDRFSNSRLHRDFYDISTPIADFASATLERCTQHDKLVHIGLDLTQWNGEELIGVVMSSIPELRQNDAHFFHLANDDRKLVWAHKPGQYAARSLTGFHDIDQDMLNSLSPNRCIDIEQSEDYFYGFLINPIVTRKQELLAGQVYFTLRN